MADYYIWSSQVTNGMATSGTCDADHGDERQSASAFTGTLT
jgi:hypothetical protein